MASKVEVLTAKVEFLALKVGLFTSKVELLALKVGLSRLKVEVLTSKVELARLKVALFTSKVGLARLPSKQNTPICPSGHVGAFIFASMMRSNSDIGSVAAVEPEGFEPSSEQSDNEPSTYLVLTQLSGLF